MYCNTCVHSSFGMEECISFTIPHSCTVEIIGGTGTGKTYLVLELIRRRREIFAFPYEKVVYIYTDFQPEFHKIQAADPNVHFSQSIQDIEALENECLLIVDDQQELIAKGENNSLISRFFSTHSHHRGITIVLLLQNPFAPGLRSVNLNTQLLILFDNFRDRSVIRYIARQICPGRTELLTQAYANAVTNREFGYLVIDLHPKNRKYKFWLRSHLFPSPDCQVYSE